ncbi:glycosyltransferase family 2 protein [Motilimonas cestriensis]|uniref:Glycosyltransferase family 2 protein n=1 Tax=Motilimonas cestriensis TaxID=2742685 RepID=A0ABS8W5A0_9GAMM|nr:glycosyltransferase family 2 protein [Motilimonas cestriensis]MCE2593698.1 glycosyltransferase family 2 protein [Motilimonas cestriensis]
MHPFVSVVIPAKNEQGNIGLLIKEISEVLHALGNIQFEVVLVNDGSKDNTVIEAKEFAAQSQCQLQVISHEASCGQSTALHTGIFHAKGEWIVTSDADGQNDPADIPALLQAAQQVQTEHFCIAGFRNKRLDTPWVRLQSKIANGIRQRFLNDGVPDSGCGLKVFPKRTFQALPYFDHMHRFLPALIKRINGKIVVCPVNHRNRAVGQSNYTAWSRAWVGVVDMFGVMWLRKRTKLPRIISEEIE